MNSQLNFATLLLIQFFSISHKIIGQSPDWLWAKSIGGTGDEYGYSIALDPSGSGDIYTTGSFIGTVDFDPGPGIFNLTDGGIYILKLDGSGNFVWAKAINGYCSGMSIMLDPAGSGGVYTTGYFLGTVDFDPGEGVFNLTTEGSANFISKLDEDGNFIWAKAMGGTNGVNSYSIAIDPSGGGVYTTGNFTGTADFDPGPGTYNLTSAGVGDIFISKLNSTGNFEWAKALSGVQHDNSHSITVDPSGSVYLTGFFRETIDFDPGSGTYNLTSSGSSDIFILKLTGAGNFGWAKAIGGGPDLDDGYCIAIDPSGSGNIYITGIFMGTVDFDPGPGVFNLSSSGDYETFILKLDGSGNFNWAKSIGGTNADGGRSIIPDPTGNGDIYTTGYFAGTVDLDPGAGEFNVTSAGSYDIFISKLDDSGNFIWASAIGGTSSDFDNTIKLDPSGNIYLAGNFQSPILAFGSTTLINANNSTYTNDIFITKLIEAPLQIDLISFKALFNKEMNGVQLEWTTASEIDNDYFTIERSQDGITFQQIIKVDGAGNSINTVRYEAVDPRPEWGMNYYRLSQTDYDGKTSYSPVVSVNVNSRSQQVTLYPNPVKSELTIEFDDVASSEVEIVIYNVLGETVFSKKNQNFDSGNTVDISGLSSGIYSIELNMDGNRVVQRVVKE